ncbi:MAG: hypothetical protein V3T05_06360 [Myxococcota bacterium]
MNEPPAGNDPTGAGGTGPADDERGPPDFSVIAGDRLVAYVWRREHGTIRRAGTRGDAAEPQAVPFADVLIFDAAHATLLAELARDAGDIDNFRFKVELEEFRWVEGAATPDARMRRF